MNRKSALNFSLGAGLIAALLIVLTMGLSSSPSVDEWLPRHLENARILQQNTLPQNTSYRHQDRIVTWKGEKGAVIYQCHTDCSGLIDSLLNYSYGIGSEELRRWLGGRSRPLARNYYDAFVEKNGFEHIQNVSQVLPGDFIAMKYLAGFGDVGHDTGHIMVVDAVPRMAESNQEHGTTVKRWGVQVIDCSHGHGRDDTRYHNGKFWPGIGRGTFSLFTNEQGSILGYSWSPSKDSEFYGPDKRPLAVGRLQR